MAFSGSSYFAGIGTAFAAIAFGFACSTMVTTSVIQSPNRLERLNGGANDPSKRDATPPSTALSSAKQAGTAKPVSQETSPSSFVGTAPPAPASDPQPAPQPQPAAPVAAKTDKAADAKDQFAPAPEAKNVAPSTVAKTDDAATVKNERASTGSVDSDRQTSRGRAKRKSSDDRKFSERRRRYDQDGRRLDEATNVIRQMPRQRTVDEFVDDDGRRFGTRPRHFEFFGDENPPPAVSEPPPRFGFFGFRD